jgi:iron complex transport system substrate-binding protein
MGQPRIAGIIALLVVGAAAALMSLRGQGTTPPSKSTAIRIASITPAGTDLLIGIGAGDKIVGVSNYDDDREGIAGKPRVGDYENIDWEKLSESGANVLVLQYAPDRVPPYIPQRCAEMGIRIVNLKIDSIDDICGAMVQLGDAIGTHDAAISAADLLRGQLDAVRARVKNLPPVRTLIVTNDSNFSLAGPGEFLDEILRIAGGQNAAARLGHPYLEVDREMLATLAPDVIIRLVPDGERKPQVVEAGDRVWKTLTDLPAVQNHRVYVVTDWYCELPGFRVGELAQKFADILHPK